VLAVQVGEVAGVGGAGREAHPLPRHVAGEPGDAVHLASVRLLEPGARVAIAERVDAATGVGGVAVQEALALRERELGESVEVVHISAVPFTANYRAGEGSPSPERDIPDAAAV